MHNKPYALKLIQEKQNGLNNYSYSQISSLTGFSKRHLIRLSQRLNEKDIDSMLVHGLTNKPSNNSPSTKQIEGHRQDPIKREQMRIDNQKQLEQVLRERDESLKARANKVSS